MRIVHVSDIHIRNLKYHRDYRAVFADLYRFIDEQKPDLIVNTGDTAHTKTQISPEFVEMTSEFERELAKRAKVINILGNHDLNLMNLERQDAMTPIIESIGDPRIMLWKKSGRYSLPEFPGFNFWVFSLADQENYPTPEQWRKFPDDVNIGLFHGSIRSCVTDSNWRMTHTEHDSDIFSGLDYVLMGDIHKRQFIGEGRRIGYAGSLIQQNFGEDVDKGVLVWNIESKEKHAVDGYNLRGSRKFYTVKLTDSLELPDVEIDEGSRIRISPPTELTLAQQKEIEKLAWRKYKPYDIITLSAANITSQNTRVAKQDVRNEDIRQLPVQERLLRDWLTDKGAKTNTIERALDLNRKYQLHVDQGEETARNVSWRINKICWNNLFNYGEGNIVDFASLGGLTGIFAPNASGKSNLIDTILETCFDGTTRGISKNIYLINDNKESATMVADVTANEQDYVIERTIERIKGGKKADWGKTTVNLAAVDKDGELESLTGQSRPETEKAIRQRLGTYEDALLTSISAQWNPLDIIACKETKRKEILYRFLDLDIFEQKRQLAKDESREFYQQLSEMEESGLEEMAARLGIDIGQVQEKIAALENDSATIKLEIEALDAQILETVSKKIQVEIDVDIASEALKVKRAEMGIEKLRVEVSEKNDRLAEIQGELSKVEKLEEKFDLEFHVQQVTRLGEAEIEQKLIEKQLSGKQQSASNHRKGVSLLREVPCGDQFPQCKFLIDAFSSKEKLPGLETELEALQKKKDDLELEISRLQKFRTTLESYKKFVGEKESLRTRRDNVKLQLENIVLKVSGFETEKEKALEASARYQKAEDDIKKNRDLDREVSRITQLKNDRVRDLKVIQDDIIESSRKMGSDQGVLQKLNEQLARLDEVRELCNAYEHYINAMGKDGISFRILTQKLPLINDEINKILSTAAQFNVLIEHDNEEQSIRLYLQYGEYKMRLIELGSGAEKMLASIAIRAALMNVSNLPKPNMFIIDEGFGKLDPEKFESVTRMFDYLKTVFEHVIVISHLETMRDVVDNVIEITSDDEGYAHVEIGG